MEVNNNINAMQNQFNQLNQNAQSITDAGLKANGSEDVGRVLTDNISLENGIDAQIASIKTEDEVFGTLLDIKG